MGGGGGLILHHLLLLTLYVSIYEVISVLNYPMAMTMCLTLTTQRFTNIILLKWFSGVSETN